MKYHIITTCAILCTLSLCAQNRDSLDLLDSIYINQTEFNKNLPPKVLHTEPLYVDLIRDLGARKGEKEWNVGLGLTDNSNYDEYTALVEYEWAPINRLGLEVELPFALYYPTVNGANAPKSRLNGLKTAAQYSFWVSEKFKTSMAIGYLNELELTDFSSYGKGNLLSGNVYNPFFVAARRWGQNFHTLLYTGPEFVHHFKSRSFETYWQINSNFHYMIDGTRNFIGIEINKELTGQSFKMIIRPQMRVVITEQLLIGIVTGIPTSKDNERFSCFFRLIYEPKHKKH